MLLIYDTTNKEVVENFGTNSMFPDGNIPNVQTKNNEILIRLHDDSAHAKQTMNAFEYELVLNADNTVKEVVVTKTLQEAQEELSQADDLLSNLQPSEADVLEAQIEVKVLTTLLEIGVI